MVTRQTQFAPSVLSRVLTHGVRTSVGPSSARYLELDGTLVFADISGFTALSERLAKRGRIGAELINELLSISFSSMLDVATGLGGDLVSFGGDALCLLFDGDRHAERGVAAAHGLRAALRRTASLRAPIDKGTLRISTGVHCGPVVLCSVGERTPMLVVAGETLTRTLQLETRAEGGEVLFSGEVHSQLTAANANWAVIDQRDSDVFALTTLRRRIMPWINTATQTLDSTAAMLGLDPTIAAELRSGLDVVEHRPATISFLRFEGIDERIARFGVAHAVQQIDALMNVVQHAAEAEGTIVLATDVDKGGGKIVLVSGIPRSSGLEQDKMLATVRRVLDAKSELPIRIGVNTGMVFAGPIGSKERAAYTTIGDTMNTAARIMAKASPGEALVAPSVLQGARTNWTAEEVAPFAAKGKATMLRASVLGVPVAESAPSKGPTRLPFQGRTRELATITEAIDLVRGGTSSTVELVGDGGLGKSRLIEEILWQLGDFRVIRINGSPFAKTQGYFAVQSEFRLAVGIDEFGDWSADLRALVEREVPDDLPLLPLIGAVFGCAIAETPESRNVAEQFRSRLTHQLVARLLDRTIGRSGVAVIVDDSHWLDEASCALVRALIDDENRSWLYAVARRPEPSALELADVTGLRRIELLSLEHETATALAEAFAADYPLSDELIAVAVDRSDGSPLLLELVLEALRSGATASDLPEEAERLIASRLDALPREGRHLLRSAAVLGMDVSTALLTWLIEPGPQPIEDLMDCVSEYLIQESLGVYRFRHALVRETAYEGLPFAERKRLHTTVVDALEQGAAHVGETVSLLAIHSVAASLHDRTWKYSREAAQIARKRGLLSQAADLARSSLQAAKFVGSVAPDDLANTAEMLGDVEQLGGKPVDAQKAFTSALRNAQGNHHRCRIMWKRADSFVSVQRYSAADRSLDEVLQTLAVDRGREASLLRAEALATKAAIRYRRGKNILAVRLLNEAWAAAERADDDAVRARINYLYGSIETAAGSRHAEFYMSEAVRLMRNSGRRVELAKALGNLGYFEHFNGRWDRAALLYDESARVAESAGDVMTAANARNNIGEVLSDQGHLEDAERRFLAAQRAWTTARFSLGEALALSNIGRTMSRRGDVIGALPLLERAAARFNELGDGLFLKETEARIAELALMSGDFEPAIVKAQATLKPLRDSGSHPSLEAMLLRIIGVAQSRSDDPATQAASTATLLQGLQIAEAFRVRFEEVMILEALASLEPGDPSFRRSADLLRTSLGIVSPATQLPVGKSATLEGGTQLCPA
jgi:class 3 adenylate cyclase/tetratricopeptide (TPR) repeat protein